MTITSPDPSEVAALRMLVDDFIHSRLTDKLDKLKDDEDDKRQKLIEDHRRENWVADAARRVAQIQLATHTLKPLHPDARGTNIYLDKALCADADLVGTHVLADNRTDDVVGNAAALDVFKFLKLSHNGSNLLARALQTDAALAKALHDDLSQSRPWLEKFADIVQPLCAPSSHTLAKQLYFPLADGSHHLLAPLYPTALVHHWYKTLEDARFGEASKAARQASKEQRDHPHGYQEYKNLVVQNFGGTKPQNISQLNSERRGEAFLLASRPPDWQNQGLTPPTKSASVFDRFGPFVKQRHVASMVRDLRTYLDARRDMTSTMQIRDERADRVDDIVDALITYQDTIRSHAPGWSLVSTCRLDKVECLWLDPDALEAEGLDEEGDTADTDLADWPKVIGARFATWLNAAISTKRNPMGDEEHSAWKQVMHRAKARLMWEAKQ